MALPTTGQLSFSQIATEIYGSTGTNRSLHTMSLAAGKITPDSVSEFYGYSSNNIALSWGSESPYLGGEYRVINRTGHVIPLIIRIDLQYTVGYTSYDLNFYYSKNTTTSWTPLDSVPKGSFATGSFSVLNIDYNDIIRIRWDNNSAFLAGSDISLDGGAVTSGGSGTVSGTGVWFIS